MATTKSQKMSDAFPSRDRDVIMPRFSYGWMGLGGLNTNVCRVQLCGSIVWNEETSSSNLHCVADFCTSALLAEKLPHGVR